MDSTVAGEAAAANMQGSMFTALTGEPYDFHPPN
jgi:hypothetical protein